MIFCTFFDNPIQVYHYSYFVLIRWSVVLAMKAVFLFIWLDFCFNIHWYCHWWGRVENTTVTVFIFNVWMDLLCVSEVWYPSQFNHPHFHKHTHSHTQTGSCGFSGMLCGVGQRRVYPLCVSRHTCTSWQLGYTHVHILMRTGTHLSKHAWRFTLTTLLKNWFPRLMWQHRGWTQLQRGARCEMAWDETQE